MAKHYRKPSSRRPSRRRVERRRRAVAGSWVGTDAALRHLVCASAARVIVRHSDHTDRAHDQTLADIVARFLRGSY